jgi:hypothetical protein
MRKLLVMGVMGAMSGGAIATTSANDARACWDGWAASTDRVSIRAPGDDRWSPERARDAATWLVRTQAILPEGARVDAFAGLVTVCRQPASASASAASATNPSDACDVIGEAKTDSAELATMFGAVARILKLRESETSHARAMRAAPLTVQVFAAYDAVSAANIAKKLNDDDIGEHGFLNVGGFPAKNDVAHVVVERDANGARIFRVVVGAFLEKRDAATTLADVAARARLQGFVRAI